MGTTKVNYKRKGHGVNANWKPINVHMSYQDSITNPVDGRFYYGANPQYGIEQVKVIEKDDRTQYR